MKRLLHTSRPIWAGENADVVETAMIEVEVAGAEYRETAGQQGLSGAQGLRASGSNPQGMKVSGPEGMENSQGMRLSTPNKRAANGAVDTDCDKDLFSQK